MAVSDPGLTCDARDLGCVDTGHDGRGCRQGVDEGAHRVAATHDKHSPGLWAWAYIMVKVRFIKRNTLI